MPGDHVTLTAQVTDNVAVNRVTFIVDGNATETTTAPFQRAISAPAVAAPGTEIHVTATAIDPSGNSGSADAILTITARPDTEKPVVVLNAPPLASPGATVHLSASASDNAGIQSVAFSVGGAAVQTVTAPPYEASYVVADNSPLGSSFAVGVIALDFSGNRTEAGAAVTVVANADTQPPIVQLTARTAVAPGAQLVLSAAATDNRGISSVDFYVDGVRILSDTQAPYATTFEVPAAAQVGRLLQLEARGVDFAGLEGTDAKQAQVVATSSLVRGTIAGFVYDNTTGLPVAGVTVTLTGADVGGDTYTQTATSDARGRYLLRATEGSGVLRLTRTGWTRADRQVEIVGNKAVTPIDARLTPIAPGAQPIDPVLGASIGGAASQPTLHIPPGALSAPAAITVTAIGQQGLQGLLPAGWSPVAAADVTPHDATFAVPATLTMARPEWLGASSTLALVRWDDENVAWRAIATQPAGGSALAFGIVATGQYAVVLGDTAPVAPPAPIAGALLSGVVATSIPITATTTVVPQSKIAFYQSGIRSDVTGLVEVPSPVSSGSVLFTRIAESYKFTTGFETHLEPYSQDLVLYQAGGAASTLNARYAATPSLDFEAATLESGVITVELFEAAPGSRVSDLIGDEGGSVTAATGERVDVPANVVTTPVAIVVQRLAAADVGVPLPSALAFVGGLRLSAAGAQFTAPVTLSVPKPPQFPANGQYLIARVAEIGGASRLLLAAIGRVVGDRIESSTALGQNPTTFEGVRGEGRYVVVQPASPVGFAVGNVRAVNGEPFTGALVSVDTLPLFAVSRAGGAYAAAAANGPVTLVALDITRRDTGSAQGTIPGAGSELPIDVRLSAQPPRVLSISPANNGENVPLSNPIVITFSEPLNPATVTPTSIVLARAGGSAVAGTLLLSNGNSVVTLRPSSPLPPDTAFTVTAAASIADLSGYTLAQAFTSTFTSLDTTAPAPPAAGSITASMPDPSGNTTVTAAQGTAGPRDTVTIVNVTRNTTTPVVLNASGGFNVLVAASLGDELRIRIVDAAGNETFVALPRFSRTNADGSVSFAMDPRGGRVDGPGGVALSIKPDSFPTGTIVTVKPVLEANFPVTMNDVQKQHFSYSGGVDIDFGGQTPSKYIDVSVPAAPTDLLTDRWVVSQVIELNGQQVMQVVDTARIIGGRITTSSPPCPGVAARGVYGFHKMFEPLGVTYGTLSATEQMIMNAHFPLVGQDVYPYLIAVRQVNGPQPICYPVLSGRATVVPNTVTLVMSPDHLEPTVQRVTIVNMDRDDAPIHIGRESIEYTTTIAGEPSDRYEVLGEVSGSVRTLPFSLKPAAAGSVEVRLGVETITLFPSEVIVRNLSKNVQQRIRIDDLRLRFTVPGGRNDLFDVHVTSTAAGTVPAYVTVEPSAFGPGNLLAKAIPGTIDPTAAEIEAYNNAHPNNRITGPARTKVEVFGFEPNVPSQPVITFVVPEASIVQGGFTFAFESELDLDYAVRETYADFSTQVIRIPLAHITLKDGTGTTVKEIRFPAPPPDEPLNLGHLSDDHEPPTIVSDLNFLDNFDPATGVLTFTFSEPMDAITLKGSIILTNADNGEFIDIEIRVSNGNRTVTIIPKDPLALGTRYRLAFFDVKDPGGNPLAPDQFFPGRELEVATVQPRLLSTLSVAGAPAGIRDLRMLSRDTDRGPSELLIATTDKKGGESLVVFDVTDPFHPSQQGAATAGFFKRQLTVVPGVTGLNVHSPAPCDRRNFWVPETTPFNGDLAVTTSITVDFTYISFFDVSPPKPVDPPDESVPTPCLMGNKILTATPGSTLFESTSKGTYATFGVAARGVATIPHANGIAAYAAIADAGLFMVDVGNNIPEQFTDARQREPMLPGDYFDVVARGGRLLAINRQARQFEVIDATLAVLSVTPLPDAPRRLVLAEKFPIDLNGDGSIAEGEFIDAVFIGGDTSVMMIDLEGQTPRMVGRIQMPSAIQDLDVDRMRRRIVAIDLRNRVHLLDGNRMLRLTMLDSNNDGIEDRILWTRQLTAETMSVRLDSDLANFYVGTSQGIEIYGFAAPNVTGRATYAHYLATNAGIDYTSSFTESIRGALVELHDADTSAVLQTSTTTDSGSFAFDVPRNAHVQIVVKAALGGADNIHMEVVDNTHDYKAYTLESQKYRVTGPTNLSLEAPIEWTFPTTPGGLGTYAKRGGAPWAILDTIYQAEKVIRRADPTVVFPKLQIAWSKDNQPSFDTNGAANLKTGFIGPAAYYSPGEVRIYLRGAENFNTDEFDSQVILHEWSHYVEARLGRSDSIGGSHTYGDKLDPRVAFGEGFATAHAAMLGSNTLYSDTLGDNQDNAFSFNIEEDSGPNGAFFLEQSTQELIWDLFDPQSTAPEFDRDGPTLPVPPFDDYVELGYKPIYQALRAQKTTRAFTSFFTYLQRLLQTPALSDPATRPDLLAKIGQLLGGENIDLAQCDEYEVGTYRLYTTVPVDAPTATVLHGPGPYHNQELQTRTHNDPRFEGNKLDSHVFLKFTVTEPDIYEVKATPGSARYLHLIVNDGGKPTFANSPAMGEPVVARVQLAPGDYTIDMGATFKFPGLPVSLPTDATFAISVRRTHTGTF